MNELKLNSGLSSEDIIVVVATTLDTSAQKCSYRTPGGFSEIWTLGSFSWSAGVLLIIHQALHRLNTNTAIFVR